MAATPVAQQGQGQHPIRPTLFLGLGGTGKEVLLRLRRRFWERFREKGLPCTRYLWIDTDTRDVDARGVKLDEAFAAVGFKPEEQFPLLTGSVGETAGDIFINRSRWEFIHDWLYGEVEQYGKEIADGAGGVRAVGRLTFFNAFTNLSQRVNQELTSLNTHEAAQDTQDFYRKHGLGQAAIVDGTSSVVYVICSVAGGTGCGTFLDLSFLLRYLSSNAKIDKLLAYLFLPNVYYETNKTGELAGRSFGNAYAALKELDFYARRRAQQDQVEGGDLTIDYLVEWEQKKPRRIVGPPFSATYLVEMKNEAGVSVTQQNRADLFSMLAECLFLDLLPGAYANAKRSDYSNITGHLSSHAGANSSSGSVVLPQYFSRRYAACGLSKIAVPVDAIRGACAAHLASEIFDYILREREDANVKPDVRTDLATYRLDKHGIQDRFGATWKEMIRRQVEAVFRNRAIQEEGHIHELEAELSKLEDRLTRSDTADKTKMGDIIKHLEGRVQAVSEEGRQAAVELLGEACLENDGRGLKATVKDGGYLHQAIASVRALHSPPEAGAKAEFDVLRGQSEEDARVLEQRKKQQLAELRSALKSLVVTAFAAKDWTIHKVLERLQDAEEQYLLVRSEMCLYDNAKKVARGVGDSLSEHRKRLDAFEQAIQVLSKAVKERHKAFLTFTAHVLFVQLFDRDKDYSQFYKLDKDEDSGRLKDVVAVREYKELLKQKVATKAGILEMAEVFEREGGGEIQKRVSAYCEERFWQDFTVNPRLVSVMDHPLMKDKDRRVELIQRLVSSARPMLRQTGTMGAAHVEAPRFAYLGIDNPDVEPYRTVVAEIEQLVRGIRGYNYRLEKLATGNPAEIYLYFSNYAYALPSLPIVKDECHEAYLDFYQKLSEGQQGAPQSQIPLHLSQRWEGKLDDLKVYDDAEAKILVEVTSIFVFGTILKVLTVRKDKDRLLYQYRRGMPHRDMVPIGAKRLAVARLQRDQQLRQILSQAILQREEKLTPDQVVSYYWALHAMKNSPEVLPETPEHTLLSNKVDGMYRRAITLGIDEAKLDPDQIGEPANRFSCIRSREDFALEWTVDDHPALKALAVWEKPSASAAGLS